MHPYFSHYDSEERPWGTPERFTANEMSTVKILHMKPGKRFSLQTHQKRSEFWKAMRGSGTVTVGEETRPFAEGDEVFIPAGTKHRLEGGPQGLDVMEIILGTYEEDDIERLEDDFGRT